jgi:hypothetical protein
MDSGVLDLYTLGETTRQKRHSIKNAKNIAIWGGILEGAGLYKAIGQFTFQEWLRGPVEGSISGSKPQKAEIKRDSMWRSMRNDPYHA